MNAKLNSLHTSRFHYPALEGFRGVAILLVVIHQNFTFPHVFFFGGLGVDLFFVLSGFLITEILLNSVEHPHFLKNFYLRRILRIFPLYYLILIICLILLPLISSLKVHSDYYVKNQIFLWTYLQNWLFIFKEPYGDKILLHTWPIVVEEQFYLLWPLIILFLKKPIRLLAFMLALLIAVGTTRYILWNLNIRDLAYSSLYTFTRIDGICIGSMVAILQKIYPQFIHGFTGFIVLSLAIFNFLFYFVNYKEGFILPYLAITGYTTFTVLFGIFVYDLVNKQTVLFQKIFQNRILMFLGKISYGIYVFHWPINVLILDFFIERLQKLNINSFWATGISGIGVSVIAVIISTFSYHYFEKPFLRLKNRFT
ncbi:MAG: acyltransferase [Chitinophagaceae bacterium]|nr:acyltransferase [Chitinophagaceae bacterium]